MTINEIGPRASGPHAGGTLALRPAEADVVLAPRGLAEGITALAGDPVFRAILERAGPPRFRRRRNGFATLLQKSVFAWLRGGWHVALAYVVGFGLMLAVHGWSPDAPHRNVPAAPAPASAPAS